MVTKSPISLSVWSLIKKWGLIFLVCFFSFVTLTILVSLLKAVDQPQYSFSNDQSEYALQISDQQLATGASNFQQNVPNCTDTEESSILLCSVLDVLPRLNATSISWGDYDADGDLDLAVGRGSFFDNNLDIFSETNLIYRQNISGTFELFWESDVPDSTRDIAWVDYNMDGDLDLVTANFDHIRIYDNDEGTISSEPIWQSSEILGDPPLSLQSFAWADIDGDRDLDLFVGAGSLTLEINNPEGIPVAFSGRPNILFRNERDEENDFKLVPEWQSPESNVTTSVDWGDFDADGDPDLAIGNLTVENPPTQEEVEDLLVDIANWQNLLPFEQLALLNRLNSFEFFAPSKIYKNIDGNIEHIQDIATNSLTTRVAWGDYDRDGQSDLATGNAYIKELDNIFMQAQQIIEDAAAEAGVEDFPTVTYDLGGTQIYRAETEFSGGDVVSLTWKSQYTSTTSTALEWVDYNNDGLLDIVEGNSHLIDNGQFGAVNRLYLNQNNSFRNVWETKDFDRDQTVDIVWNDYDNDGDLDLTTVNLDYDSPQPIKIYRNDSLRIQNQPLVISDNLQWSSQAIWGDYNSDSYIDILIANRRRIDDQSMNAPNLLLKNAIVSEGEVPFIESSVTGAFDIPPISVERPNSTVSIAWGDYDADGDLDAVIGNGDLDLVDGECGGGTCAIGTENWILKNTLIENREIGFELSWRSANGNTEVSEACDAGLEEEQIDSANDATSSVMWGDYDNDGDLDLAVGNGINYPRPNQIYRNDGLTEEGTLQLVHVWCSAEKEPTRAIAWGDYDNDGDLDLAVANRLKPNQLYEFQGQTSTGTPIFELVWQSDEVDDSLAIAWGDYDGNNYLDLVVGNRLNNRIYTNINGRLETTAGWISQENDTSMSVAWGDYDNDGDLDLAVGNGGTTPTIPIRHYNRIYRNDNGRFANSAVWTSSDLASTNSVEWGDYDNDGDLDLLAANMADANNASVVVYVNSGIIREEIGTIPSIYVTRPGTSMNANHYSSPSVWSGTSVEFDYSLMHAFSQPVSSIIAEYSIGGGGWETITQTFSTETEPLSTTLSGVDHTFQWNIRDSGIMGQSDDVRLRLKAVPAIHSTRFQILGPYLYGSTSAATVPFRVRGTQIRVVNNDSGLETGIPTAQVFRINGGDQIGGQSIGNSTNVFQTDNQGYLQGRGELSIGDQLLALAPAPDNWWEGMPWLRIPISTSAPLTKSIRLYYTNGTPTNIGVSAAISSSNSLSVTQFGVQELQVSPENPLLLFDLRVALEWDASTDPNRLFLNRLEADLQTASEHIYDFTNGQAALGHITVTQNAEDWAYADVIVQATNRLRPYAVQGGIVPTTTVHIDDVALSDGDPNKVVFETGHVRMGATWRKNGDTEGILGEDWPLALAHELSHYLFFLDDTYLAINDDGLLIPSDDCVGSVMGDMYDPSGHNSEFVGGTPEQEDRWDTFCGNTLANRMLGQSEWKTIKQYYPMLDETQVLTGPAEMPYNFTEITILDPLTPTNTLPEDIFYIQYENQEVSSPSARAYLIKEDAYILELGNLIGGRNELTVRGAAPDDLLCVVDGQQNQSGCAKVTAQSERIGLKKDPDNWQPRIDVRPITTSTLQIQVDNLPSNTENLQVRVFSELGFSSTPQTLNASNNFSTTLTFTATLTTSEEDGSERSEIIELPILQGHVVLYDSDLVTGNARTITTFSIGGNAGSNPYIRLGGPYIRLGGPYIRLGGPYIRLGGPYIRLGGTKVRTGNAPIVSPDGQMIFFTQDQNQFKSGELYTVQNVDIGTDVVTAPPTGKRLVGSAYRIRPELRASLNLTGSISFQYLGVDVRSLAITEEMEPQLTIHYFDEQAGKWRALETVRDGGFNFASAKSQGAGIYALFAGPTSPVVTAISPAWLYNETTTTITMTGSDLLAPINIRLVEANQPLTPTVRGDSSMVVDIPVGLSPQAYTIVITNGDQITTTSVIPLSVLERRAEVCFYDEFESGVGQWAVEDTWGIVELLDGTGHALTDSPDGTYDNATPGATAAKRIITSRRFDLSTCPTAVLSFEHAYVIAKSESQGHQDWGIIEISATNGETWAELARYSGGGVFSEVRAATVAEEWRNVELITEQIDLSAYSGQIQLRFIFVADENVSDKGWIIDTLSIKSGEIDPMTLNTVTPTPVATPMQVDTPTPLQATPTVQITTPVPSATQNATSSPLTPTPTLADGAVPQTLTPTSMNTTVSLTAAPTPENSTPTVIGTPVPSTVTPMPQSETPMTVSTSSPPTDTSVPMETPTPQVSTPQPTAANTVVGGQQNEQPSITIFLPLVNQ